MEGKEKRNDKERLLITLSVIGVLLILLILIVNKSAISAWASSRMAIYNPVIIGLVIAYLCNPIYNMFRHKMLARMKREKLKKAIALTLTYLALFAVITLLVIAVIPQVVASYSDLEDKFDSYLMSATQWADRLVRNSKLGNGQYDTFWDFFNATDLSTKFSDLITNSGNLLEKVINYIILYANNLITGAKDVFMGLFISLYVLIFKEHLAKILTRFLRALFSRKRYDSILSRLSKSNRKFGDFIIGKLIDSAIIGVLTFIVLSLFKIPYTPLIAVIVGVTNIIPVFGPMIGAIPSAFIIFIASPSKALVFIVLITIIQQLDGNLIGPFILGSSTGLTSLGVILAITIMGGYWGIPGMFVGVPLFAVLFDLLEEFTNARLKKAGDPEFPAEDPAADDPGTRKHDRITSSLSRLTQRVKTAVQKRFSHTKK